MPIKDSLLPQMLHPAYRDWVRRPGEMLSFWLWTGPDAMKDQMACTGANAASVHAMMCVRQDDKSADGVVTVPVVEQLGWMELAPGKTLDALGVDAGVGIGEHNNAWFVRYPDWFWALRPQAAMQDKSGQVIRAGYNPFPAVDDELLNKLSREQMGGMVRTLKDEKHVRYWVLGGEQSYPDYFGLAEGDYRPDSLTQFRAWQGRLGKTGEPGADNDDWYDYRESALADYYAGDTAFLRACDQTRPVLIPTHGNPFMLNFRSKMGYPVDDLAGCADGFEAGPISIDGDSERLIRMTLDLQTSFGLPVAAPRLANKQLDTKAQGGGRGFNPESLRRTIYEALGMGVWHLGLVQWEGNLPDGEWGIAGTPAEAEAKKVFAELKAAAPYLEGCSRLMPQVCIFISDATWRREWQDRWTLLYDEAVKRGWHVMLVMDARVEAELARETPVLISADNAVITQKTRARLAEYTKAGGTVVSVGEFGTDDGHGHKAHPPAAVQVADDANGSPIKVIHQTQNPHGAATWSAEVKPLPMDALEKAVGARADLRPVRLTGPMGRIECLPLTDGTNLVAVLINRSGEEQTVRLEPSPRIRALLGDWQARNIISGKILEGAEINLKQHETALVSMEPLGHGDTKAYAAKRRSNHLISIASSSQIGNKLQIEAKVTTPDGKPASNADVRVRLVPGRFEWHMLKETQPGVYALQIPLDNLPRFYNPSSGKYELANGITQLVFEASVGDFSGGARATVKLIRDK